METKEIIEGDKLIAEFMKIKWKPVRADWSKSHSCYHDILFDTQEKCLAWCTVTS